MTPQRSHLTSLLNLGLRGLSLGGKALFILVAAKYLDLEDLGLFGLVSAAVSFLLYVVGLDFYVFTTRQLPGTSPSLQAKIILGQFRFYALTLTVGLLPLALSMYLGIFSWWILLLGYGLLVTEHLSQEFFRLLVTLGRPGSANIVLFLRSGSWSFLCMALLFWWPELRKLETILICWLIASAAAAAYGFFCTRFVAWRNFLDSMPSARWVLRGVRIALPLLASTLLFRAVFTLDRYALEALEGMAITGVYVVYLGIGNLLFMTVDTLILQFRHPPLLAAVNREDEPGFRRAMLSLCIGVTVSTLALAVLIQFAAPPLLHLLDKPEYLLHLDALWWIVAAHAALALSHIPHYGLYALRRDRLVLLANALAMAAFAAAVLLLDKASGIERISCALFVTFCTALIIKSAALLLTFRDFSSARNQAEHV